MTRYVIAEVTMYDHLHKLLDLLDAEHVHVTIRDGTVTAVPMHVADVRASEHPEPVAAHTYRGTP